MSDQPQFPPDGAALAAKHQQLLRELNAERVTRMLTRCFEEQDDRDVTIADLLVMAAEMIGRACFFLPNDAERQIAIAALLVHAINVKDDWARRAAEASTGLGGGEGGLAGHAMVLRADGTVEP
jgi:hypothetical protein